jgi:hypothetical protein
MKRLKVGDYVRELDGNAVGIVVHIMRDAGLAVVNWPPSQHGLAFHPLRLGEGARAMNTIESWTLSDGERREIARKYCTRIVDARINNSISETPSDAWLNAELRERGCPDTMLERWRKRIHATPLHYIADGGFPI